MRFLILALGLWCGFLLADPATVYQQLVLDCNARLEEAGHGHDIPFAEGLKSVFEIEPATFRGSWLTHPYDANSQSWLYQRVTRQALEVAKFLRNLQAAWGFTEVESRPFRAVQIVPRNLFGWSRTIDMVGDVLILRMGWFVIPAHDIMTLWNKGKQYPWRSFERRAWRYENPVGAYMKLTKKILHTAGGELREGLEQLSQLTGEDLKDKALSYLRHAMGIGEETPQPGLEDRIRAMPDEALRVWLGGLAKLVQNDKLLSHIVSAAKAKETPENDRGTLEIEIAHSWVIHGNWHWITVGAGYANGELATLVNSMGNAQGAVVQRGKFKIVGSILITYSVDVVDVRAFSGKLLMATALEKALAQ